MVFGKIANLNQNVKVEGLECTNNHYMKMVLERMKMDGDLLSRYADASLLVVGYSFCLQSGMEKNADIPKDLCCNNVDDWGCKFMGNVFFLK